MFSKPLAVGVLGLACVSAAAGGAYVAARHNEPAPIAATPAAATEPVAAAPVQDTEAVVSPSTTSGALPPSTSGAAPMAATNPLPVNAAVPLERPRPDAAAVPATSSRRASSAAASRPVPPAPASHPAGNVSEAAAPAAATPPSTAADTASARTEPAPVVEAPRADPPRTDPVPPAREFVELEVPSTSVLGLRIETPVSTETARLEDRVDARVMRDVAVDGRTAIPAGTRALGAVTTVERGGKVKERARLGVRFHTLVLADGSQLPVRTDTIVREGESPAGDSARKIGGAAVGGAILGALMGGKKGAIVGSTAGAAGGSAIVMAGDRNPATLPSGAIVTVRLSSPLAVEVEKK